MNNHRICIPDYSTLCRYRNWLAQDDTLSELLELINRQLAEKNLKVAQALFDELVVAIGINPEKRNTYTIDERRAMLEAITGDFPNVRICVFENRFLVRYAREIGAGFIVRGIRSAADYEYERSMRYINSDLVPEISTVFLMPPREIAEVSSTMVKGLVGPDGWRDMIRRYLPEAVYDKIVRDHDKTANDGASR